jgi:hypothetical protein
VSPSHRRVSLFSALKFSRSGARVQAFLIKFQGWTLPCLGFDSWYLMMKCLRYPRTFEDGDEFVRREIRFLQLGDWSYSVG